MVVGHCQHWRHIGVFLQLLLWSLSRSFVLLCRSFLLNRDSFHRSYENYLSERPSYLELLQRFYFFGFRALIELKFIVRFRLPRAIETLRQLKLPNKLIALINTSNGRTDKFIVSSSSSSSSISLATTTSHCLPDNESNIGLQADFSLFDWITAQVIRYSIENVFLQLVLSVRSLVTLPQIYKEKTDRYRLESFPCVVSDWQTNNSDARLRLKLSEVNLTRWTRKKLSSDSLVSTIFQSESISPIENFP